MAAAAYGRIPVDSAAFPDRLEDSVRYQLTVKKPVEAFRLTELARRLRVTVPLLPYYRALAKVRASVCVLGHEDGIAPAWQSLLDAHMYRFPTRFEQGRYSGDPYHVAGGGTLQHHLDDAQTDYLADIPRATLLAGTGCRFAASGFKDRPTAAEHELEALEDWFHERSAQRPAALIPGEAPVEMRLVELALAQKLEDLARAVMSPYAALDAAGWVEVPDPERRFIWQRLVETKLLPPPPYKADAPTGVLVRQIALGIQTPDAALWLGMLEPETVTAADRFPLFAHLLTIPDVSDRPYLLVEQAHAAYRRGDLPGALGLIRRLLLLGEAEGDGDVERSASALAARIFLEYHYDAAMLGAVQAALPAGTWGTLFRRLMMQQALAGDTKGYGATEQSVAAGKQQRSVHLREDESRFLDALARRRLPDCERILKSWSEHGAGGHAATFLGELGEGVLQLTPEERQGARLYLEAVAAFLRARLGEGGQQARLLELLHVFGGEAQGRYDKGSDTARGATVAAGVVDLTKDEALPWPFEWGAPAHLPLRDLLPVPETAAGRGWVVR